MKRQSAIKSSNFQSKYEEKQQATNNNVIKFAIRKKRLIFLFESTFLFNDILNNDILSRDTLSRDVLNSDIFSRDVLSSDILSNVSDSNIIFISFVSLIIALIIISLFIAIISDILFDCRSCSLRDDMRCSSRDLSCCE
jgi:hypothetical protein